MNHLDAVFLLLAFFLIYKGYKNGFIHTLKKFTLVIGGTVVAYLLSSSTYQWIYPKVFSNKSLAQFTMFIAYMFGFYFLAHILEKILLKGMKKLSMEWVNQALGSIFGVVKSCALIFIFVSMVGAFNIKFLKGPIISGIFVKKVYLMVKDITNLNLVSELRKLNQWKKREL